MLKITNVKPKYFVEDIDEYFEYLVVSDCFEIINEIVKLNNCVLITKETDIDSNTLICDMRMKHSIFGSLSLSKLPTGLKALFVTMQSIKHHKCFCCYEFVYGANIIKYLLEVTKNVNNISVYSKRLTFSELSYEVYTYKVKISDKGKITERRLVE